MKRAWAVAALAAALVMVAAPVAAETTEELQRQLAAEKAKNEELRRRVEELERMLAEEPARLQPAVQVVDAPASAPPEGDDDPRDSDSRALERALVVKGLAVLRPYTVEFSPSLAWSNSGSNLNHNSSRAYIGAASLGVGLPWDAQVTAGVPYYFNAQNPWGENEGVGDASLVLSKQLVAQSDKWPSVVAAVGWSAPTGQDSFESPVPLGSGFDTFRGTLSVVKAIDPLVYYGDVSYRFAQARQFAGIEIEPGASIALRSGGTLAVTPDISLSAGLNFAFVDEYEQDGIAIAGSGRTIGAVELGAGVMLSRSTFLYVSGQFGVTDDASDAGLNVVVPVRF